MPRVHWDLVGGAVGSDDHDGLGCRRWRSGWLRAGSMTALGTVRPVMATWTGVPALRVPLWILDADPDFDGGAAGIERGADEGDLGGDGIVDAGDGDGGGVADLELLGLDLRDVELGDQRGGVHDGDERRAGGWRFRRRRAGGR